MSRQVDSRSLSASSLAASTLALESAARKCNAPDLDPPPLRSYYYLERPDGSRTALIEVDLLPELVRIRGLPPKLSAADTACMTSVEIKRGGRGNIPSKLQTALQLFILGSHLNTLSPKVFRPYHNYPE